MSARTQDVNDRPSAQKQIKSGHKPHKVRHFAKLVFFSTLLVYAASVIINTQAEIAEQKATIEKLEAEIVEAQQENDEYVRLLGDDDEYEYMLSAAIARGYAYPRETRYYAKSAE
ncbi:MAG: hypothetical protein LUC38_04020 [Oscillospiraceae bacterium]|nr:hypothetical protein [Ruminococcus sp.]MCD8345111.1 hypothetical protein [Oscillospiraceae bacterium]